MNSRRACICAVVVVDVREGGGRWGSQQACCGGCRRERSRVGSCREACGIGRCMSVRAMTAVNAREVGGGWLASQDGVRAAEVVNTRGVERWCTVSVHVCMCAVVVACRRDGNDQ